MNFDNIFDAMLLLYFCIICVSLHFVMFGLVCTTDFVTNLATQKNPDN